MSITITIKKAAAVDTVITTKRTAAVATDITTKMVAVADTTTIMILPKV
jgi:hypothetical protein